MFTSIIYVLYLYVWEYHLCLVNICLQDIDVLHLQIQDINVLCMFGSIICLVFVCLGISCMSYFYVWGYQIQDIMISNHTCTSICMFGSIIYVLYLIHPNIQIQDIDDTPNICLTWMYHLCFVFVCLSTPNMSNTKHK